MYQVLESVDWSGLNRLLRDRDRCHYVSLRPSQMLKPGDWVCLNVPPSEYAQDIALLLGEVAEDQWLTWVPEFGEIEFCLRQLCPL